VLGGQSTGRAVFASVGGLQAVGHDRFDHVGGDRPRRTLAGRVQKPVETVCRRGEPTLGHSDRVVPQLRRERCHPRRGLDPNPREVRNASPRAARTLHYDRLVRQGRHPLSHGRGRRCPIAVELSAAVPKCLWGRLRRLGQDCYSMGGDAGAGFPIAHTGSVRADLPAVLRLPRAKRRRQPRRARRCFLVPFRAEVGSAIAVPTYLLALDSLEAISLVVDEEEKVRGGSALDASSTCSGR